MVRRSKWEMVLSSRGIFSFEWLLSLCAINREVNWTVSKCRLRYLIVKMTWKQLPLLSVILKVLGGTPVLILVSRVPEQEGNDALRSTENSNRRIELPEDSTRNVTFETLVSSGTSQFVIRGRRWFVCGLASGRPNRGTLFVLLRELVSAILLRRKANYDDRCCVLRFVT